MVQSSTFSARAVDRNRVERRFRYVISVNWQTLMCGQRVAKGSVRTHCLLNHTRIVSLHRRAIMSSQVDNTGRVMASSPDGQVVDIRPLRGLSVIELEAIGPVPFAGLQLMRFGATVVRVVSPASRALALLQHEEHDLLNRGKAVLHIDLKSDAGRADLQARLTTTDVLLEGFRPGVLERLGLAPLGLRHRHPGLVIARLSGFGRQGPLRARAGHDINFLALSGALAAIGQPDRPSIPLNLVADFGGGAMHLVAGVLAALVRRGIDGSGSVVDTSILGGTLSLTTMQHALLADVDSRAPLTRESSLLDGGCPFYAVYATADDRFVAVGALEARFFAELLTLTGLSGRIDTDRQYDRSCWPDMQVIFTETFIQRDRDAWAADAAEVDCCVSPVLDFHEAMSFEQSVANGWIDTAPFDHPGKVIDVFGT